MQPIGVQNDKSAACAYIEQNINKRVDANTLVSLFYSYGFCCGVDAP